eukprot:6490783-Amphidinium_carterae.2
MQSNEPCDGENSNEEPPPTSFILKLLDKRGLKLIGMVDHFACILPVLTLLSMRFSNFKSLPECNLILQAFP